MIVYYDNADDEAHAHDEAHEVLLRRRDGSPIARGVYGGSPAGWRIMPLLRSALPTKEGFRAPFPVGKGRTYYPTLEAACAGRGWACGGILPGPLTGSGV